MKSFVSPLTERNLRLLVCRLVLADSSMSRARTGAKRASASTETSACSHTAKKNLRSGDLPSLLNASRKVVWSRKRPSRSACRRRRSLPPAVRTSPTKATSAKIQSMSSFPSTSAERALPTPFTAISTPKKTAAAQCPPKARR